MTRASERFETTSEVLRQAETILRAGLICDDCLGRAFGMLGHGLENDDRGKILRERLALGGEPTEGRCWVCEGLFSALDVWARRACDASHPYEFESYLFGVRLSPRQEAMEKTFFDRFPTDAAEPLKRALNRRLGKAFEALAKRGTVSFTHPHLTFTVDFGEQRLSLRVASLCLYGRYRKLVRGLPQTHWPCRACRGTGCAACHGTGKQYPESVEELIGAIPTAMSGAAGAQLHGAGREDIDARMLGSGRPFVLELLSPRRRSLDLESLTDRVNASASGKVEILDVQVAPRGRIAEIKEARAQKRYRALVVLAAPIDDVVLRKAAEGLVGVIEQRTPARVAHRRADLTRRRRVHAVQARPYSARQAELVLETDGGLYIKELISGDAGRTCPSLAERLGFDARVEELDVLDVRLPGGDRLESGDSSRKVSMYGE